MKNIVLLGLTIIAFISTVYHGTNAIVVTGETSDERIPLYSEPMTVCEVECTIMPIEEPKPVIKPVAKPAVKPIVTKPVVEVVRETKKCKTEVEKPDNTDVEYLACVIYQEAGGLSEITRFMVGDVVLNRANYGRYFPDTIEGVLTQKNQYGTLWKTGIVWPERSKLEVEGTAVKEAYDIARRLLSGEHSDLYGKGYIYQAEFKQGSDIVESEGVYFGKE